MTQSPISRCVASGPITNAADAADAVNYRRILPLVAETCRGSIDPTGVTIVNRGLVDSSARGIGIEYHCAARPEALILHWAIEL